MSDDEDTYFSEGGANDSDSDVDIDNDAPKIILKPSVVIKKANIYSEEPHDDADLEEDISVSDSDDDIQIGGDSDLEEGEIDDDDDDEEDDEEEEDGDEKVGDETENVKKTLNKKTDKPKKTNLIIDDNDEDEEDEYDDNYLQKFDNEIMKNYINDYHPECLNHNYDEILKLTAITKNAFGIVIDPLHKTIPYLTKYERARILGQRAKQLETGAKPLVKVPENIIDSYIIAELELREKKIPFIIRRPIPGGGCEYWNLRDLEVIAF